MAANENRKQQNPWSGKRLVIGIWIIFAFTQLATLSRVYALNVLDNLNSPSSEMIRDRLISTAIGLLFILIIVTLTRYFLQRGFSINRMVLIHLVLIWPISFAWYASFNKVALWACQVFSDCAQADDDLVYGFLLNANATTLIYLLTVAVTYTYYYVRRDNENQLRQSQMETNVLQARMKMLRSQLHPHFLFNTLNSVHSLMDIDVSKAKVMVVDLADLLRKVLDWKDVQKVPLREELALLQRYVDIEKIRFSEDLEVTWQVDESALNIPVPAMLLQPLVENALHHGFSPDFMHLKIEISVEKQNEQLLLRVNDDGQGFKEEEQAHIFELGTGLQNTRERLATLYGDNFSF